MQKLPKIPVIELFGPTIQGEGLMSGTVTHFLRTGGCGLRCTWCDSMYAVDPAQIKENRHMLTITEIHQGIKQLAPAPYVTFTGGDPCIHKHLGDLVINLNFDGIRVAVETQGQLFPDWLEACDVLTFSPKGPSSDNVVDIEPLYNWLGRRSSGGSPQRRAFKVCIKVVVFNEEDFEYAMEVYDGIPPQMYDSFYVTAGTPLLEPPAKPISEEDKEAIGTARTMLVLQNQQALVQMVLAATQVGKVFNDKFHIGCQQHVLLWPTEEKGV